MKSGRNRRIVAAAISLAAGAAMLVGCTPADDTAVDRVLTIAVPSDTVSLDPVECNPMSYCSATYDGLVYSAADGSYEPDIAASWQFLDDANTQLEFTLREGVTFSSGTPVTADIVASSINYFKTLPPNLTSDFGPIDNVEATSDSTIVVHYLSPVTEDFALFQFSSQTAVGRIVGPDGQADRSTLQTVSDGVGPYVIDADNTVPGSEYQYVPNENYFAQDAIKWDRVVIRPVADTAARLSSLRAGEVDWAQAISPLDSDSVAGDGFQVSQGVLASMPGLVISARAEGPLADVRVRQAIAYAIPRDDVVNAVFDGKAQAISTIVPDGSEGSTGEDPYAYDLDKARELLAEAGYADGFSIALMTDAFWDPGFGIGQIIQSSLAEIGITVTLDTEAATPDAIIAKIFSGSAQTYITGLSAYGTISQYRLIQPGGAANPLGLPVGDVEEKLNAAVTGPDDERDAALAAVTAEIDEQAWVIPVVVAATQQAVSADVTSVPTEFRLRELNPFAPIADLAWGPAE